MRILHVTTFLQGGAGRIITALALAQRRVGHDVVVVTDSGRHSGYESYPEYIQQLGAAGVMFRTVTSTFTRDVALNVQAVRDVTRMLGSRTIDVAHTHAAIPTLVARLALARGPRVPVIQTMHGWGIRKTPEQAATDITLLGRADAVVTPSAAAREMLGTLGLPTSAIQVIAYGIEETPAGHEIDGHDTALFEQLRASGRPVALCIGSIGARKNQALLVRALASADGVTAIFIGEGDAGELRALAAEVGVTERIHVLGYRAEASRYLSRADVLVLPSMNEGLPLVLLEAFRAGVPVVASAIPEIAEAVGEPRAGVLFEPGDAAGLAAALAAALTPQSRAALPARAKALFAARYRADQMLAAYDRLYADLRVAVSTAPA